MPADRDPHFIYDDFGNEVARVVYDPSVGGSETPWVVEAAGDYVGCVPTRQEGVWAAEAELDGAAEAFFFPRSVDYDGALDARVRVGWS